MTTGRINQVALSHRSARERPPDPCLGREFAERTRRRHPRPGGLWGRRGPKLDAASGYRRLAPAGGGRDPVGVSRAGFEKRRVRRRPGRVRWAGVPPLGGENREPRDGLRGKTAGADGASRSRYRAVGAREERGGRVPSDPLRAEALPGRRGEPAGRRNRPPERRREAGRRGPSDGGSRLPIDRRVRAGALSQRTAVWTGRFLLRLPGQGPPGVGNRS